LPLNLGSTSATFPAYVSEAAFPPCRHAAMPGPPRTIACGSAAFPCACALAVLFHRHGRSVSVVEAGEWYLMEDSWGSSTLRTKMRMASRRRGAEALATAVKALLTTAGNPSELSGTRIPSPRAIAPDVTARGGIGSVDGRPPVGASGGEGHEDIYRNWADAPTLSLRDLELPEHERFRIYRKLPLHAAHDEL
jgi:hypothetical protein